MCLEYYHISENPFEPERGNTYLWLGGSFSKNFSSLEKAITERKGIILLTGDAGTGKRTLIKMVTEILTNQVNIATISNPDLSGLDFFNVLALKLGFDKEFKSKSAFLVHLRNVLRTSLPTGKNILLIIFEGERSKSELFEELALLSDLELNGRKMISILVVGRKGWTEEPNQKVEPGFLEKITALCNQDPLNAEETIEFIEYCLSTVGARANIFSKKALQKIFLVSGGNLSLINLLCGCALKKGYLYRRKKINAQIIKECEKQIQKEVPYQKKSEPAGSDTTLKPQETVATGFVTQKGWFWLKAFLAILFLFSSFLLYDFQTKDSFLWKSDEIAQKDYIFDKPDEAQTIPSDDRQGIIENPSSPVSNQRTSESVATADDSEKAEYSVTDNANLSAEPTNAKTDWPFPTFKKIVYFKYDSNTLPAESLEILDKIADYALHNPGREFTIKGYTDSTGAGSYNLTVSQYRADSVRNYLIAKGVDPDRMETFGLGSQEPIFSNSTAGGRKLNRRVEIELKLK